MARSKRRQPKKAVKAKQAERRRASAERLAARKLTERPILAPDPSCEFVTTVFEAVFASTKSQLSDLIRSVIPSDIPTGTVLGPIDAAQYLHRVRDGLEALAREEAQAYPPGAWLWYTRRITRAPFRDYLMTTETSDHSLMETLTGLSQAAAPGSIEHPEGKLLYDFSAAALRPVATMACIAIALGRTHAWLRRAGKGTSFTVVTGDLPDPVEDDVLESAIERFDQRVVGETGIQWHPTMGPPDPAVEPEAHLILGAKAVVGDWPVVPGWEGRMTDPKVVLLRGAFITDWGSLDALSNVMRAAGTSGPQWWASRLPSLIAFLQALGLHVSERSESAGVEIPKVGYLVCNRRFIEELVDYHLPRVQEPLRQLFGDAIPTTGREVLGQVAALNGELWPVRRGPVLRRVDDESLMVDVSAASRVLDELIAIPRTTGGHLVNLAAHRLESEAQRVIDGSPWAPSAALKALWRRTLRLVRARITDVDAIGEQGDVLLLVSCKNLQVTPEYNAGDYYAVRNVRTNLEDAVDAWARNLEKVRAHPVGDNYDFTGFREIVGVVVAPHVFYVQSAAASAVVATSAAGIELPASASLGELRRFLGTSSGAFPFGP